MKSQKLIVIAAIVCLLVGASGAALAQDQVQPTKKVQPNLAKLVADVIAQALTAEGYDVYRRDNLVAVDTPRGNLTMRLPGTLEALKKGKIRVFVDGVEATPYGSLDRNAFSGMSDAEVDGLFDLLDCIDLALKVWFSNLGWCDIYGVGTTDNILCIIRATFDLGERILECTFDFND